MAGKKKILVIDDDQDVLAFVHAYLEHHGYDVYLAHSAREGMRLTRESKPDLIVLDVMMPDGSGLDAYPGLKEAAGTDKPVPILIYSAAPSFLIFNRGLPLDKSDVIRKSENINELLDAIRDHLNPPAA
ncbi:MAG: response regulator [Elusimicrobia bacterium]|nr:response regulator [Elusimicrobiota bacterium]